MNSHGAEYPGTDSRLTFQTFRWRVDFWKNFVRPDSVALWVGHGVGAADDLASSLNQERPRYEPHNDYLRVFYDSGILGLFLFINLIFCMLRLLMRSANEENDFIVLLYLLVLGDFITDNFIYYTHSLWLFLFLATFVRGTASAQVQPKTSRREPSKFGRSRFLTVSPGKRDIE
jgi:O-antigen ligase